MKTEFVSMTYDRDRGTIIEERVVEPLSLEDVVKWLTSGRILPLYIDIKYSAFTDDGTVRRVGLELDFDEILGDEAVGDALEDRQKLALEAVVERLSSDGVRLLSVEARTKRREGDKTRRWVGIYIDFYDVGQRINPRYPVEWEIKSWQKLRQVPGDR